MPFYLIEITEQQRKLSFLVRVRNEVNVFQEVIKIYRFIFMPRAELI